MRKRTYLHRNKILKDFVKLTFIAFDCYHLLASLILLESLEIIMINILCPSCWILQESSKIRKIRKVACRWGTCRNWWVHF